MPLNNPTGPDELNPSTDILLDFAFKAVVEGFEDEISFTNIDGLEQVIGVEDYKEGGENTFTHHLPARVNYKPLVLKRGIIATASPSVFNKAPATLIQWFENALNFYDFQPRTVTVTLYKSFLDLSTTTADDVVATVDIAKQWVFVNAWPTSWKIGGLNSHAEGSNAAILYETIELNYQYFFRVL